MIAQQMKLKTTKGEKVNIIESIAPVWKDGLKGRRGALKLTERSTHDLLPGDVQAMAS